MFFSRSLFFIILFWFTTINSVSFAQDIDSTQNKTAFKSWDRFSLNIGGFFAGVNTGLRIGSKTLGIGVDIKLEDALGLHTSNFVFRNDAMYRFGGSRRHSIKASYFSFLRSANKVLETELEIGDHVFPIGTEIDSRFDLLIFNVSYDYSFFRDRRVNLGVSLGAFIMPMRFQIDVSGKKEEATEFVAPLPVLGLRSDFAVSPKLYLKYGIELLYLRTGELTGLITDLNIRLEYNAWKHFGMGMGINMYRLRIEADDSNYPGMNFTGNIEMGYTGLLFYAKFYL